MRRNETSSSVGSVSNGTCFCSMSVVPISSMPCQGMQKMSRPSLVFGITIADAPGRTEASTTM